jgi:hypothetical protein
MHRTSNTFWSLFERLPEPTQRIARKNFNLLKTNPSHPSLHFKKVGTLWSARIGINYRALAVEDGANFIWIWIGSHDDYSHMIKEHS